MYRWFKCCADRTHHKQTNKQHTKQERKKKKKDPGSINHTALGARAAWQ